MERMAVGYELSNKRQAQYVIQKMMVAASKEEGGRLGHYVVEDEGEGYRVYHVMNQEELEIMKERCGDTKHTIHVSGRCTRCHQQVEDER